VPTGSASTGESDRQGIVGTLVLFALLLLALLCVPYTSPTGEMPVAPFTPTATESARLPTARATSTASSTIDSSVTGVPAATRMVSPLTQSPLASPSPSPTPTVFPSRVPATRGPSRIVIPSIDLDSSVVEVGWKVEAHGEELVSEWEVADYAVGFHRGSAYPGHVGNTVLSGHHNIRGEVFRDLHLVEPGDDVYLYVGIQGYRYVVEAKYRLREKDVPLEIKRKNARWIQHTDDERLTLVTCWPYSGNSHRIVVVARPE